MLLEAEMRKMLVNGEPWAAWQGYQLPVSDEYVCIWTPRGTRKHWKPNYWKPDFLVGENNVLTYIWPAKWFAIHISYDQDGKFSSGYCDVTLPAPAYTQLTQDIAYIDLYLDVVIREDFSVYTKDQEVYERAAQKYQIVADSRKMSYDVMDWLEHHAQHWSGPFEVMPRQLPRTNWDGLSPFEIRQTMQKCV